MEKIIVQYLVLWMRTKLTDNYVWEIEKELWKFQWIFYMHSRCLVNESWLIFHNRRYFGSYRVSAIYRDNLETIIGYSIFFSISHNFDNIEISPRTSIYINMLIIFFHHIGKFLLLHFFLNHKIKTLNSWKEMKLYTIWWSNSQSNYHICIVFFICLECLQVHLRHTLKFLNLLNVFIMK